MSYLSANAAQSGNFASEFMLQKFLAAAKLPAQHTGPRLPGKRKPRKKRRTLALNGPLFAFQRVSQCRSPLCRGGKHAPLRSYCRLLAFFVTDQSQPGEFIERVINLGAGNASPVAHL